MKEEWKKVKFGDFIELHRGYDLTKESFIDGPYPVVCSTSIMGYHNAYKAKGPGVIIGRSGTLGQVQYVETNYWPHNTSLYVSDFKGNDIKYVKYFLQNFGTESVGGGAAVPTLNRNHLSILDVEIPPLPTQQKIASILSAYDDLIENNRKQIKLLEEAALKLYKEWFVKLNFPGHETTKIADGVPDGWKKVKAGDYFDITIGKTPPRKESKWFSACKGKKWISIADMGNSGTYILNTSEYLTEEAVKSHNVKVIPANTVLLSFKLTVGRVSITSEEMTTNEAIAHFVTDKDFVIEYLYLNLKNYNYNSLGSTSAISTAINSKIVKSMPIIIPDEKILKMFSNLMKPYFNKIKNCQLSIVNLQLARDKLLPKLMNGEIEV